MNAIIIPFKHSSRNVVICHATPDTMGAALRGLNSMFGYMSYIEHCYAAHARTGQDIFKGGSQLVLGGLMHDERSLLLQQWQTQAPAPETLGVHEFTVVSDKPNAKMCEYYSFSYTGKPPYVAMRREMQVANPTLYASITGGAARLNTVRPIWEAALKDFPDATLMRPPLS